ncbi:putative FMNH2-dependent monooxygenase SfnC [Methylobacterium crusticola]|uniref:FMNH2-dependent monooxygenase SfnC n=1 Tax=Methylobacterium crusticola TaxID=1697972 RepID=A0ABQ4QSP2_9HYPH|nr:acyl-CoA dehydrogenase family protein [Methylobacterium crusticola]GJD48345.1 putative FMNH2-dependent monooxygenase SfnC [Methylobacterium crusticola]
MSFDPDLSDPYLARAAALREIFARDAAARDREGGRPTEQIRLLKDSGLLKLLIPREHGGHGAPWSTALRIVREFAKVDGSLGHLFGYHFGSVHGAHLLGSPEQAADLYRRSAAGNWFWGNARNSFSKTLFGRRDGAWITVNGFKPFTSGSHVADHLMIAWLDEETRDWVFAPVPADRPGVIVENDWDAIGQRQTGSGRVTFADLRVHAGEVLDTGFDRGRPYRSLGVLQQQSTLLNVFVGSAQGALLAARDYTTTASRPWIHSGVEKHTDDPWVKRTYGDLVIRTQAATALADRALEAIDAAFARGRDLTEAERGEAAVAVAAANAHAGAVALEVTSTVFEVMGARASAAAYGFDRFWRNVRTHTLHNPAEYKIRNVGTWFLTGAYPEPGTFQ